MNEILSESHRRALEMMLDARKILYNELHYPGCRTHELVEGVNRLGLAFEYVEHPRDQVIFCPQCESFCLEINQDGSYMCLNCEHHWF